MSKEDVTSVSDRIREYIRDLDDKSGAFPGIVSQFLDPGEKDETDQ